MDFPIEARPSVPARSGALLCPTCGESLPLDARFCPHDGEELVADGPQHSGTRAITSRRDSLVGWVVDERYEVMQLLGEGGMGCVYRVRHRVLGRQFALKALRPELARDPILAERFVQEARTAAAISHPNVVIITDFGLLDRGQPYFVMELLEGRTLSSVLRERLRFDAEQVALIAGTIASALAAAHAVGVIHRDLKPDNVILLGDASDPGQLKVLDFGLAKLLGKSRLTEDDIVYGTPQYMSPEQAAGEPLDPRVDVYALGILMYEMLTGSVPFEADSYMGVLTKQLYVEPAPLSSIGPVLGSHAALEQVVLRCLSKDRDARFRNMPELILALGQCGLNATDGGPADLARTRSPALSSPVLGSLGGPRSKRRSRWWAYTWVGVAALGLALGLLFGRLSGGVRPLRGESRAPSVAAAPEQLSVKAPASKEVSRPEQAGIEIRAIGGVGVTQAPPVATNPMAVKRRLPSSTGRPISQPQQPGRLGESPGAPSKSFGDKSTPGSSEIVNPWAE